MACFTVPAAEAIITTIATKAAEKKELTNTENTSKADFEAVTKVPFSRKLRWLGNLLWGGSALLAFEHVWHGEVVPWFPFLTAASDPADAAEMLHEMSTVGVGMALLVTAVWGCMLGVTSYMEKKAAGSETVKE